MAAIREWYYVFYTTATDSAHHKWWPALGHSIRNKIIAQRCCTLCFIVDRRGSPIPSPRLSRSRCHLFSYRAAKLIIFMNLIVFVRRCGASYYHQVSRIFPCFISTTVWGEVCVYGVGINCRWLYSDIRIVYLLELFMQQRRAIRRRGCKVAFEWYTISRSV